MRTALRSRSLVHAAVVAATAAALVLPGTTAEAAPARTTSDLAAVLARFPGFTGLPDSRGLNLPVLLHGTLGNIGGGAMSGAEVLLSAWPSREAVRALPKGATFSTTPIARTIAGSDGRFELRSALTPLLTSLTGKEGLDVELTVFHGGRQYAYLSQLHPLADLGAWVTSLADGLTVEPTTGIGPRNLVNITLDPKASEQLPAGLLGRRTIKAGPPEMAKHEDLFPGHWCSTYKKYDRKVVRQIAASAIARNGAVAHVTYAEGAQTASSAGVSLDAGLNFAASGSRSTTSTIDAEYEPLKAPKKQALSNRFIVEVAHGIYEQKCMLDHKGGYRLHYKTAPDKAVGTDHETPQPAKWTCNRLYAASVSNGIKTSTERAYEYEKGFSFIPLGHTGAGFFGATRSGYSKAVAVKFTFPGGKGKWCGHTGYASDNDQIVQGFGL